MGLRPTDGHESPPSLSFLAQIDMTLRLTLYMKMREALWSAVACYRFTPGQLASRAGVRVPRRDEAASKLAGSKRQQAAALHSASGA